MILYADHVTDSMKVAIDETTGRPPRQAEYNRGERHHPGDDPEGHSGAALVGLRARLRGGARAGRGAQERYRSLDDLEGEIKALEKRMREAAKALRVREGGGAARRDPATARPRVPVVRQRLPALARLLDCPGRPKW